MDNFISPFAELLALYYELVHSYAGAIALLTITVMIVLLPLTVKGTRSMLAMQKLAPEIKKLQDKHKNDRQKLNEEVMALYKDNKISPLGGCLPLLLQLPVFLVLYHVIAGLTRTVDGRADPKYLDHSSQLYTDLVDAGGRMVSFGFDLSLAANDKHTVLEAIPYFGLIAFMVIVQYWQQHQISSRAPAAETPQAKQMKMIQKVFPPVFGVISISFPAGVVLYWVVSSLFRVGQQWAMYRFDPVLKTTVASAKKEAEGFLKEKDSDKASKSKEEDVAARVRRDNTSKKKKKKRKGK